MDSIVVLIACVVVRGSVGDEPIWRPADPIWHVRQADSAETQWDRGPEWRAVLRSRLAVEIPDEPLIPIRDWKPDANEIRPAISPLVEHLLPAGSIEPRLVRPVYVPRVGPEISVTIAPIGVPISTDVGPIVCCDRRGPSRLVRWWMKLCRPLSVQATVPSISIMPIRPSPMSGGTIGLTVPSRPLVVSSKPLQTPQANGAKQPPAPPPPVAPPPVATPSTPYHAVRVNPPLTKPAHTQAARLGIPQ